MAWAHFRILLLYSAQANFPPSRQHSLFPTCRAPGLFNTGLLPSKAPSLDRQCRIKGVCATYVGVFDGATDTSSHPDKRVCSTNISLKPSSCKTVIAEQLLFRRPLGRRRRERGGMMWQFISIVTGLGAHTCVKCCVCTRVDGIWRGRAQGGGAAFAGRCRSETSCILCGWSISSLILTHNSPREGQRFQLSSSSRSVTSSPSIPSSRCHFQSPSMSSSRCHLQSPSIPSSRCHFQSPSFDRREQATGDRDHFQEYWQE